MEPYEAIAAYTPWNEQEARDRELILAYLAAHEDAFLRSDLPAHVTASAWVVNPARDKVLMAFHKLYGSWAWIGGHADGDTDLLAVALRELREETGVAHARPVSTEIYSLEVLTVDGHEKRGAYVPSHLHLNVTYLLEAGEDERLHVCEAENSAVRWFGLEEAVAASTEPWFAERIYRKLNAKLRSFTP
ncbi:MAG: NUDIX hydrolase [Oscillospiraceae bacterium]|nr:NUDIX hydrolase [Oscillospiraceae bacterium]